MTSTTGVMIGSYIITRMRATLLPSPAYKTHPFVQVVAIVTIAINALCLLGLFTAGTSSHGIN